MSNAANHPARSRQGGGMGSWLKQALGYFLSLGMGAALFAAIAWLVHLAWPAAAMWVFWILFAWWAWIGWVYVGRRSAQ